MTDKNIRRSIADKPYRHKKCFLCVVMLLFSNRVTIVALLITLLLPIWCDASSTPKPTLEQRVEGLEAYLHNTNPALSLEDTEGHIAKGLTMPSVGVSGPGHTAWMMMASALILFMTLPGLALFYGGMVRRKNVLSVMAQCLGITSLVTMLWWLIGYSLVFSPGGNAVIGGFNFLFLKGVGSTPNPAIAPWVAQNVFAMFQLMFAIIAPALIVGAIAERMRYKAILAFIVLWMFLVYFPLAHMVWGEGGLLNGIANPSAWIRTIDFAGGTVIHMSSGWSALVLCIVLGRRLDLGQASFAPHSLVLCMVGTGMLWVGWYGFNAGSALGVDGIAANAFLTTTLAAAASCGVWAILEYLQRGKASVLGFCSGVVTGLVIITPAAGFVDANAAILMSILGTPCCFLAVVKLKSWVGYDDALDAFGIHAMGGTVGALLTGFFARADINANLATHLGNLVGKTLWVEQLKAIAFTIALAVTSTLIIVFILKAMMPLRAEPETEITGLDLMEHGEEGYSL